MINESNSTDIILAQELIRISIDSELRKQSNKERKELYHKLYLGEIIDIEKPTFKSNSLILAPVGSGKSHLIEKQLIPKNFNGKILYLTSNTALKDSICPNNNELRRLLANNDKSIKFHTTGNKNRYGNKPYNVHVMTYHEFGHIIQVPARRDKFTKDIDIIFCDEIHSLPTYHSYDKSDVLGIAMSWIFDKHEGKQKYYFTATKDSLDNLEKKMPGYLDYVTIYDYLDHPKIRKYIANSTTFINHIEQIRPYLNSKLASFNYYGYKGLAFTSRIGEQEKLADIAASEGFKPIILWSTNNEKKMNKEQLRVRNYILSTGNIPEPYNLLIINNSMQEGWNLDDDMMRLAILDTTDITEQIQALGRIRRDIDLLICKTNDRILSYENIEVPTEYLDKPLTSKDKTSLYIRLNIIDSAGNVSKWPSVRKLLELSGYEMSDNTIMIDGKQTRVTTISLPNLLK